METRKQLVPGYNKVSTMLAMLCLFVVRSNQRGRMGTGVAEKDRVPVYHVAADKEPWDFKSNPPCVWPLP